MFVGAVLLGLVTNSSILSFLTSQLQDEKDPDGIFDQPFKDSYDYIVVGSGSAGSIIATRLSEDPVNVLLLEAGGSDLESEFTRIPFSWVQNVGSKQDWGFRSVPQNTSYLSSEGHIVLSPRGKILGGTGSINGMLYTRGSRYDYDGWRDEGCTGWGYDDVLLYFKKSEDIQIPELMNSSYHGKVGPLVITSAVLTPLDFFHRTAAKEKGIPVVDCNGAAQTGYCIKQANIKDGERCSSASCFLRPALKRTNLHVTTYSHVARIIVQNGTATGVVVIRNGTTSTIKAKQEIILSAGVFGSPQILMLSGIGPSSHLQKLGIPLKADLPVGMGMQDNLQMHFHYSIDSSLNVNTEKTMDQQEILNYILYKRGILSRSRNDGYLFANIQDTNNRIIPPDLQMTFIGLANEETLSICALDQMNKRDVFGGENRTSAYGFRVFASMLHDRSRGTVRLRSKDPFAQPLIDPQYLSHQDDVDSYLKLVRFMQNFANNTAWKSLGTVYVNIDECNGYCKSHAYDSNDYWRCMIRYYATSANHQTSTCRMGSLTDRTAVVDPYLKVKGINNLRVADASVMRNVPSANTNAASMMIGEKAADMIKESRRVKNNINNAVVG